MTSITAPAPSATEDLPTLFASHRLSPTQRRIAQFILDHPSTAAFLSSVELAERVGVSQPSVTRFASALGFDRYQSFLRAVRESVLGRLEQQPPDLRRNTFQVAITAEIDNLTRLSESLSNPQGLTPIAELLATSQPLTVLGLRVSAGIAGHFAYCAQKLLPDVRVILDGGSAAYDLVDQAVLAGGTCLLAFVLPRYPREALSLLDYARKQALRIVLVSDSPVSPAAIYATHVLTAPVGSRLVFDSHVAPEVTAMVLLEAISNYAPEQSQRRLERFEQSTSHNQAFWAQ